MALLDVGFSFDSEELGKMFDSEEGAVSELVISSGAFGPLDVSSPQATSPNAASTVAVPSTLINFFWFLVFLLF